MLLIALTAFAHADDYKWSYKKLELINQDILEQIEGAELYHDHTLDEALKLWIAQSDDTPPEVRLWAVVEGPDGAVDEVLVTDQPESLTIGAGQTLVLFASANESDGGALETVEIFGETQQTCIDASAGIGTNIQALWFVDNPDPDPTDTVLYDWRLVGASINYPPFPCPAGYSLSSASGYYIASAFNLAGLGSSTAALTVTYQ